MIQQSLEYIQSTQKVPFKDVLNPGADSDEISEVEEIFGKPFPTELKQLYSIHNGETFNCFGFFFGLEFMSLEEIQSEIEFNQEETEDITMTSIPTGSIKEEYYHDQWIPFAADGSGNFLAVDMDPGENGTVGQIINYGSDEDVSYVISNSLDDFLSAMARIIDEKKYFLVKEDNTVKWNYEGDSVSFLDQLSKMDLPLK